MSDIAVNSQAEILDSEGRQTIRSIIQSCLICFKNKPKLLRQFMGNLPKDRINPSYTFYHTGIDFGGPFPLKPFGKGRAMLKGYVALFICFSTKAVHLELVSNLTTESFIGALTDF